MRIEARESILAVEPRRTRVEKEDIKEGSVVNLKEESPKGKQDRRFAL